MLIYRESEMPEIDSLLNDLVDILRGIKESDLEEAFRELYKYMRLNNISPQDITEIKKALTFFLYDCNDLENNKLANICIIFFITWENEVEPDDTGIKPIPDFHLDDLLIELKHYDQQGPHTLEVLLSSMLEHVLISMSQDELGKIKIWMGSLIESKKVWGKNDYTLIIEIYKKLWTRIWNLRT